MQVETMDRVFTVHKTPDNKEQMQNLTAGQQSFINIVNLHII
jgi:hypothetical protein